MIDIEHEVAVVDRRVHQAGDQAAERVARSGRITGRASSPDGGISVEVAPGGLLTDVRLSPAALSADMETLARQITVLADRATRLAGGNMHEALAGVVGEKHLESLGYVPVDDEAEAETDPDADFGDPLKHGRHRR
ncbi:YbaB/EbfC family nucleoid-associated protein [Actinophytocola sp.]|uniref:YbaB/EbfC family nucleoid-associated protein n=1 Tax=Actinophytocola sp. TaxID=1872138 RepID=UPI003D6BD9D3